MVSMHQRCSSWRVSPREAGWQQCQAPWDVVLWLVNTGQQRPIDQQNCLLLKATGAWGSCHTGPSKCHIAASNERIGALSTLRWTSHQASDFHNTRNTKRLLRCVALFDRNLQASTAANNEITLTSLSAIYSDHTFKIWWRNLNEAGENWSWVPQLTFFHCFVSPSRQ